MAITREDVEHIARLARLKFSEEDQERFASQLAKIVEYVEKLNELKTEGVAPTAHVIPLKNVTRPDELRPSLAREKILKLAPRSGEGFVKVPKVIE
jgi:aspartyl-tRNA(Asn)/glutamyl-tRNA(Gln) amidotransferase subunit C